MRAWCVARRAGLRRVPSKPHLLRCLSLRLACFPLLPLPPAGNLRLELIFEIRLGPRLPRSPPCQPLRLRGGGELRRRRSLLPAHLLLRRVLHLLCIGASLQRKRGAIAGLQRVYQGESTEAAGARPWRRPRPSEGHGSFSPLTRRRRCCPRCTRRLRPSSW